MELLFILFALFGTFVAFVFVSLQWKAQPSREQERKALAEADRELTEIDRDSEKR